MPRLALLLVLAWFLSLFVFRTWLQWRRTGSTGIHGFAGSVGSLEWNAGLLVTLGMLAGVVAPLATLLAWPGGTLWFGSAPLHTLGAVLLSAGTVGALIAQMDLGDSWRIGVREGEQTQLVTGGLYAWVRNPIFSFILLTGVGLVLLLPNAIALFAAAATCAGIEFQVRRVEEPHLLAQHGSAYRAYASRVGRFIPGVGLLEGGQGGHGMTPGRGRRVAG